MHSDELPMKRLTRAMAISPSLLPIFDKHGQKGWAISEELKNIEGRRIKVTNGHRERSLTAREVLHRGVAYFSRCCSCLSLKVSAEGPPPGWVEVNITLESRGVMSSD
jgi:hypothetical protein